MATTTFAGNLAADPATGSLPDGMPVAEFRVLENRRRPDAAGHWVDADPTPHDVRVFGTAARHVGESLTKGAHVIVHGTSKTKSWVDASTGEKRTRTVVDVTNKFGEVGLSLRWTSAHAIQVEHATQEG